MKLCQKIVLDESQNIRIIINGDGHDDEKALTKPIEMSFHPFLLQAFSKISLSHMEIGYSTFNLSFTIVDDEREKPIFFGLSPNHSVLLIAELIQGIKEAFNTLGLIFHALEPKNNECVLSLAWPQGKAHELVGTMMILKASIDSLLFVRGLRLKDLSLENTREMGEIGSILQKIIHGNN